MFTKTLPVPPKQFVLYLLICLIPTGSLLGQGVPSPLFELPTDTIAWQQLPGDQFLVLPDTSGKLSFNQVTQPPYSDRFHVNNVSGFDYAAYAFWFQFRIKNIMDHDVWICLSTSADYTDYYVKGDSGTWQHFQTGKMIPWNRKDGLKNIHSVPILIKKGAELTVFRRDRLNEYKSPKDLTPAIGFEENVIRQSYVDNTELYRNTVLTSILAGMLFLAAIFNMFFYRAVREKVYLSYSLFTLFYAFIVLGSPIARFMFPDARITFSIYNNLLWSAFVFATLYFIRYYFETPRYHPRWHKVLSVAAWIFPIHAVIHWSLVGYLPHFWVKLSGDVREFMFDLVFLFFFITAILYLLRKNSVKSRIVPAIPVLFYWGIIFTGIDLTTRLGSYFGFTSLVSLYDWLNKWNSLIELCLLGWLILFFSWRLFRRYQELQTKITDQALEKEKERNELIAEQKIELEKQVTVRTAELKQSLEDLQATQSQLVHSEKMASLGELTAGIAHEIQNPLNFVNNFSEINTELIGEMKQEMEKGNVAEAKTIADSIEGNEQKIIFHGKRADAIVKSMLQHSRKSTGQKEPTDINAVCDEYLRLAYHGLRAKDKSFNVKYETDFDDAVGTVNVVTQDIGRVLLNLINNAFYAAPLVTSPNHVPFVRVSTRKKGDKICISVGDNGPGISAGIRDKIFQPFFTTKPAGQGTGLGLSLSYDIITKGHGGSIDVQSVEGGGTTFIIMIPANK